MSRSYRLSVFALGLTLLAALAHAQPANRDSGRPASTTQRASAPQAKPAPPPPVTIQSVDERIAAALKAQEAKQETAEEKKRADADLIAQQDMARWARAMVWVGGTEAAITFCGVLLVLATLIYTKRAADAAVRANTHNADTTHRTLRAYLNIVTATVNLTRLRASGYDAEARIILRNGGQTPARMTSCKATFGISSILTKTHADRELGGQESQSSAIIGPGEQMPVSMPSNVSDKHFTAEHGKPPTYGGATLFVHMKWEYTDYLGHEWTERVYLRSRPINAVPTIPFEIELEQFGAEQEDHPAGE